jgi:hypothetical protein
MQLRLHHILRTLDPRVMTVVARLALLASVMAAIIGRAGAEGITMRTRLDALVASYPETIAGIHGNELVLKDGHRLIIDDGKQRTHEQKLESGDIKDMLEQIYPVGACVPQQPPPVNFEPGRIRNDALFKRLYGGIEAEVRRDTVAIDWLGQKLPVTRRQGVDRALASALGELSGLAERFRAYLTPSAGTFNWRPIAGTTRLSPHSFAAAIDINTAFSDYWRWAPKGTAGEPIAYKNRIPPEVVHVFERHGFIWGGRWYHYDTMHFEYRPELIRIGKLAEQAGCKP